MARKRPKTTTLLKVCEVLDRLAPLRLAQSWDNVGLLVGDYDVSINRVMLCIDLTPEVAKEATNGRMDLVVAYHPPLFKPIARLTRPSHGTEDAILQCIRAGISIYSTHTALDAAEGGTNDRIADLCGLKRRWPLEYVTDDGAECKLVVFVPSADVDNLAEALFEAGAGRIGDYEKCSYRLAGTGTFRGTESTNPTIGKAGRYETVDEIRVETVVPQKRIPEVMNALRNAHPYEEPAFDIYPLQTRPHCGIGRFGPLSRPMTLARLAAKLKKSVNAPCPQFIGDGNRRIERAIICVGSAGSLPFKIPTTRQDVIVTGEIRHHDALTILRRGCTAIALGHWSSERPVLESFADALKEYMPSLKISISNADAEPFAPVR